MRQGEMLFASPVPWDIWYNTSTWVLSLNQDIAFYVLFWTARGMLWVMRGIFYINVIDSNTLVWNCQSSHLVRDFCLLLYIVIFEVGILTRYRKASSLGRMKDNVMNLDDGKQADLIQ